MFENGTECLIPCPLLIERIFFYFFIQCCLVITVKYYFICNICIDMTINKKDQSINFILTYFRKRLELRIEIET